MSELPFTVESFYRMLGEKKLMAAKCLSCGRILLPPRPVCPNCYGTEMKWVELKSEGTVESYTVIHVPPARFAAEAPYVVMIVKMDEGVKLPGRLVGVEPEKVRVGMRVKVEFEEPRGGRWPNWPSYRFRPVS